MTFSFNSPTTIHFGPGVSKQLGSMIAESGGKKVFLFYDKGVKAAGLVDGVIQNLKDAGLEYMEYDGVLPNPPDYQVHEAAEMARGFKADALVAVGGGSTMDTAKAVNVLLTNPGKIRDYDGINKVKNPVGPLYAIPTTAGTGSEVTVVSVVTDVEEKRKMVIFGQYVNPTVALADPELTYGLPPAITASTGMDALTHAIESYLSLASSPMTDALNLDATRLIMKSLLTAYKDGKNLEARSDMLLGSLIAGVGFANTSLGLVHSMAHPMGAHCNVPHGVGNAIALPYVMEFNIPDIPQHKMILLAQAMGFDVAGKSHDELGLMISGSLAQLSKDLNIPRIRDIGVPKDLIPTLANDAVNKEISTMTTPRKPTVEEVIALYEKAW